MRRFYASPESIQSEKISLDADQSKHLREVLRLQNGDEVAVFDGNGKEILCTVEEIGGRKSAAVLKILQEVYAAAPESNLDLTLGVALLKGEKFDLVVQKAVELGVTKLVPVQTKRCDVKIFDVKSFDKKLERRHRIALEAAKQSGRAKLLEISELVSFDNFIENADDAKILFSERGGVKFSTIKSAGKITAITGAEGGWEDSEIEAARHKGFQIITLGGRILRAETAAIAIAGILQHRFGDFQ